MGNNPSYFESARDGNGLFLAINLLKENRVKYASRLNSANS